MRMIWFFVLVIASLNNVLAQKSGVLAGTVVVIDPGHGGKDPGSHGLFQGQKVVEDEYIYDVALRLKRAVEKNGGIAFLTIQDKKEQSPRDWAAQRVFPDNRTETFSLAVPGSLATTIGLKKRLDYSRLIKRRHPKHHLVYIAIHFDVVGKNKEKYGVRIITSKDASALGASLATSFALQHRLREEAPVVTSGDKSHGIRRLYILSDKNPIIDPVLVELGNFQNESDVWRIRNPVNRDLYTNCLVDGIIRWRQGSVLTIK